MGCHFLLQCMKVKSESEFAQSCPTLSDPMDCSPPGSSIRGIFQARVLEWGAIAFSEYPCTGDDLFYHGNATRIYQESTRIWQQDQPVYTKGKGFYKILCRKEQLCRADKWNTSDHCTKVQIPLSRSKGIIQKNKTFPGQLAAKSL